MMVRSMRCMLGDITATDTGDEHEKSIILFVPIMAY